MKYIIFYIFHNDNKKLYNVSFHYFKLKFSIKFHMSSYHEELIQVNIFLRMGIILTENVMHKLFTPLRHYLNLCPIPPQ